MSNLHPLEVVGRGSETQLQVGEYSNKLTWQDEGEAMLLLLSDCNLVSTNGG